MLNFVDSPVFTEYHLIEFHFHIDASHRPLAPAASRQ